MMELESGEEAPLRDLVSTVLRGAFKSREVLEAELPAEQKPVSEDFVLLQRLPALIDRQGVLLAHLAVFPATRASLMEMMPGLVDRAPAWLEAEAEGAKMGDLCQFNHGLLQTLSAQRPQFERVVADQVLHPDRIEEDFAENPVPERSSRDSRRGLNSAVGDAVNIHTRALFDIAYDLELNSGRFVGLILGGD